MKGELTMNHSDKTMEKIVALCKNRGFIFPGSEIYGGLANSWDYGPLGSLMKQNVKAAWWKKFVQESPTNVGLDAGILMNPRVWEASGHVVNFNDPLIDCKSCKRRHRADKLIEDWAKENGVEVNVEAMTNEAMVEYIRENKVACPGCGACDFSDIKKFNLMFKTHQGVTQDSGVDVYLRPETAQGIFVDYKSVQRTTRRKVPFGVCQIGKSFRNEITPGNFIFRTLEFEQMEMEFFCKPGTEMDFFKYWKQTRLNWHVNLGMGAENYRFHDHEKLAHYANAATDIEFNFPFGFKELEGIHSRTDFDLGNHAKLSGKKIQYYDPETGESYTPYCVETSIGVDRMFLAVLSHAYTVEELEGGESRVVLRIPAPLAPIKVAVLPLLKKDGLPELAQKVVDEIKYDFNYQYDEKDSIGKRYRRQDAIGTPFCVTVDHDSLKDNCVTVRDRDTMEQVRVPISELRAMIDKKVNMSNLLRGLA